MVQRLFAYSSEARDFEQQVNHKLIQTIPTLIPLPHMHLSDEEFREEFKPLFIPAHFEEADTLEQKITFALAQLGQASATQVYAELQKHDTTETETEVTAVLDYLFEKGRIKGAETSGTMHYDLSKITQPNNGAVNPDLLAPGLD